ncbi:MAG: hypothetical protein J6X46_04565 [Prevotella sp.]|nr:hypothetical protein [Prevotella sp.]
MLTAMLVISGCNSGKNKNSSGDPDIQLVEMSDDEKSQAEVRYVMLHINDFSFDEADNGTFEVDDKMKHTQYVKLFEMENYQDALGSIVTEIDKVKGYGIRMKLGDDQRSLEPEDKYFSGLIWHIRPGKTYIEYIFDSEEPRRQFLKEAVAEGFTQVNDSLYSKGKPKVSCISLSKYKGFPSLMLICY